MSVLGLLIAGGFGAFALRAFLGRAGCGPGGGPLVAVLGAGLGVALFSVVRFAGLIAGLSPVACQFSEAGLLLAALAAVVIVVIRGKNVPSAEPDPRPSTEPYRAGLVILGVLVAGQLAVAALAMVQSWHIIPFGLSDAWTFWNLRARVLAEPGEGWRRAFDGSIFHSGYPPFLPLTVLRGWEWAGAFTQQVPFAISVAFFALTGALLFALLYALRGTSAGLMAVALFLATSVSTTAGQFGSVSYRWSVLAWGASQYADLPLAFFYLASLGCMALAVERQSGRWLAVLALTLTAAAWTKNEGQPWLAVGVLSTTAVVLLRGVPRSGFLWFLGGLLPLGIALVVFKLGYAGPNDLIEGQAGTRPTDKLLDWSRHKLIWQFAVAATPRLVLWLLVLGVLLGVRRGLALRLSVWMFVQLAAVAAAYYLVYILTPHPLPWHLGTSIDRLFLQLWPGFLFAMFYLFRTPAEILADDTEPGPPGVWGV